jgi:DNA-binding NarL/FixJ family response regulator
MMTLVLPEERHSVAFGNYLRELMKHARVMLADDHKLFAEAVKHLLEPHFEVVGTATDGIALLESAEALRPDVVVIDLAMPLLNGLNAAPKLKQMLPKAKLIFLTMHEDPDLAVQALRVGASGYLLKKSAAAELLQAIHAAIKGESYVTPEIARGMEEAFVRDPEGKLKRRVLTQRQREVLQLLSEGKSMKEAAAVLGLTPRTIAFHKYRMMEELGVKTTAELIQFAIENHVVVTQTQAKPLFQATPAGRNVK